MPFTLNNRLSRYLLVTVCNIQIQEALNCDISRLPGSWCSGGHLLIKTFAKQHQYTSLSPTHTRRLSFVSLATYRDNEQPWNACSQQPTMSCLQLCRILYTGHLRSRKLFLRLLSYDLSRMQRMQLPSKHGSSSY